MSDELRNIRALKDDLTRDIRKHGLDPEVALAAIIPVVADQMAAFVMNDAREASGTALSRGALLRRAEDEMDRFSSGVLAQLNASLQ